MIKCAIIEDEIEQANKLDSFIKDFSKEKSQIIESKLFSNAFQFLENYKVGNFDIVFFDIKMPYINGVDASKLLREKDENIIIIFVTSLAQYAISGYQVGALDYLLKPIKYEDLSFSLTRAIKKLSKKEDYITLSTKEGEIFVKLDYITYIETSGHNLIVHKIDKEYITHSSLKDINQKINKSNFEFCNRCYLVNLNYVESYKDHNVTVNGVDLQISQPKRKIFLENLKKYSQGK